MHRATRKPSTVLTRYSSRRRRDRRDWDCAKRGRGGRGTSLDLTAREWQTANMLEYTQHWSISVFTYTRQTIAYRCQMMPRASIYQAFACLPSCTRMHVKLNSHGPLMSSPGGVTSSNSPTPRATCTYHPPTPAQVQHCASEVGQPPAPSHLVAASDVGAALSEPTAPRAMCRNSAQMAPHL